MARPSGDSRARRCRARATTGVVTRADLVEGSEFTDPPFLCARRSRAEWSGVCRGEAFLVSRLHYITHRGAYIIPSLCKYL